MPRLSEMTGRIAAGLPRATWRLLKTGARDGSTNMAIDEAVLTAVAENRSPPTVRFYEWEPPCVSIGYAQSMRDEIDLEACRQRGYTWVRRPTGGRAVLLVRRQHLVPGLSGRHERA